MEEKQPEKDEKLESQQSIKKKTNGLRVPAGPPSDPFRVCFSNKGALIVLLPFLKHFRKPLKHSSLF